MDSITKGRRIVIGIIVTLLLLDVLVITATTLLYSLNGDNSLAISKLIIGLTRFILSATLLYYLYKGKKWARNILVGLIGLASVLGLLLIVVNFTIILVILTIIYVTTVILLLKSSSVREFLNYQRRADNAQF